MINFAYGMVVAYFIVCFFFAAQYVNDMRIILNHQAPDRNFWGSTDFFGFRPSLALFRVNAASIDLKASRNSAVNTRKRPSNITAS
jgi:hypothetical protein